MSLVSFNLHVICCWIVSSVTFGQRPNIILFVADDMGYGDLASYGHPSQERGPIDRLAEDGIRFMQTYSAATFCTPSRAAMLTGTISTMIFVIFQTL